MMSTDSDQSNDIFFQVKKEILDKLDIILQKMNLETINKRYELSNTNDFTFIELSQFQTEISTLFVYLDKLYESLNTSISAHSSIFMSNSGNQKKQLQSQLASLKEKYLQLQTNNLTMRQKISGLIQKSEEILSENTILREQIEQRDYKHFIRSLSDKSLRFCEKSADKSLNIEDHCDINKLSELLASSNKNNKIRDSLKNMKQNLRLCKEQIKIFRKYCLGQLKQFKFRILEDRVEIIGKIKEWSKEAEKNLAKQSHQPLLVKILEDNQQIQDQQSNQSQKQKNSTCNHCTQNSINNNEAIISELDFILSLCQMPS